MQPAACIKRHFILLDLEFGCFFIGLCPGGFPFVWLPKVDIGLWVQISDSDSSLGLEQGRLL